MEHPWRENGVPGEVILMPVYAEWVTVMCFITGGTPWTCIAAVAL